MHSFADGREALGEPSGGRPRGSVAAALIEAGLSEDTGPVSREQWQSFLHALRIEEVRRNVTTSPFEALFRASPTPTMSQDYTLVVERLEDLRSTGVTDLEEHLIAEPDVVTDLASEIVITAANNAAVEVTGVPRLDLLGRIDRGLVNVDAHPSWRAQLLAVWNQEPLAHAEFLGVRGDGSPFRGRMTMVVPKSEFGLDFSRVVLTIHDISEEYNRHKAMEELVAAKTRFVASVSHELRTPLTAVLGFAEILYSDHEVFTDAERQEFTSTLRREALDAAHLVEDLLVAARAELGQMTVTRRPLDPEELMRSVTGLLDGAVEPPVFVGEPTQCIGDGGRIRQILRNLLTNAERYGGDRIRTVVEMHHDQVRFKVCDDGAGILEKDRERVFEPFQRATTNTHGPSSVGIGLSVSRHLAELMGGTLTYLREDGWSVFVLSLPTATSASLAA